MNWQLLMVAWIIILTEYTGSPTLLPCARPLSPFAVHRDVCRRRLSEVLYMGQKDERSSRSGL